MPDKIGRFELVSQLAHSESSAVYKASDPETGNFVALKAIRLEPLGDQAATLIREVQAEAESAKMLNSHNVVALYGAGEMDGQLCALMEYVQGNSIATMLERKEGFSIWDLQDIARQTCQGLDHAHVHKVYHHSLEPAKIMVQWDGITRILGFGISTTGDYAAQSTGKPPQVLHYMSPEQLSGDPVDARSNFFSMGAILYEMVTERKAFDGEDAAAVRLAIMEQAPVPPNHVNGRVHPALSALIMKALAKAPEERYQSGQELINDLEKCKDAPAKKTVGAAPAAQKPAAPPAPKAAAPTAPKPTAAAVAKAAGAPSAAAPPAPKHFAAAAGQGSGDNVPVIGKPSSMDSSSQFITNCVKATIDSVTRETPSQSAATVEPQEAKAPGFAVDPMMDENRQGAGKARSFSEIDELPPLKEVYVAPETVPHPLAVEEEAKPSIIQRGEPEKPKTPPREIAKKAVNEIKKTPPQLFLYSLTAAVVVILAVVIGLMIHLRSSDSDDEPAPPETAATAQPGQTAPAPAAAQPKPIAAPTPAQITPPPPVEAQPAVSVTPKYHKGKSRGRHSVPAEPNVVYGQLSIDSTPSGAEIQIDGQNSGYATPFNVTGVAPGQHVVTIRKNGYASEMRSIQVSAGGNSVISVQLAPLAATVSLSSTPSGSAIWMDGKNTERVTPAQFSVDRPGNHIFVFKKQGYLDQSTSANLQVGQNSNLSATLQALGNTDDIKIGGRFKKLFGGSETAGMGKVSVKTDPKGAQVAVNNRMLDKLSPVDFFLNPGTYEIDISLSGFKSIHKVINVDKSAKVVIDESLNRE